MGHRAGSTRSVLAQRLIDKPRKYTFLKAVDILYANANKQHATAKGLSVANETILFRSNPSFGFPSADVDDVYPIVNDKYEMVVNFLGLYGPASPLPDYYTQSIIDELVEVERVELSTFYIQNTTELLAYQEKRLDMKMVHRRVPADKQLIKTKAVGKQLISTSQLRDLQNQVPMQEVLSVQQWEALKTKRAFLELHHVPSNNQRDFMDVFNHRLVSLYLEASHKYHPYRYFTKTNDYFCDILFSLMGAPPPQQREESNVNWIKLLPFAGLLSLKQGSAELIKKIVSAYFGIEHANVVIEEQVQRKVIISRDQRAQLGLFNTRLGEDFMCGKTVVDYGSKFRIHIKELGSEDFFDFLPGLFKHKALYQLVDFIKAPEQHADVCLHLKKALDMPLQLSTQAPAMLGYSSWLSPTPNQTRSILV